MYHTTPIVFGAFGELTMPNQIVGNSCVRTPVLERDYKDLVGMVQSHTGKVVYMSTYGACGKTRRESA